MRQEIMAEQSRQKNDEHKSKMAEIDAKIRKLEGI
jgi:hypothetical protein